MNRKLFTFTAVLLSISASGNAAVNVSIDETAKNVSLQITESITFSIPSTYTGTLNNLVFDEWATSDGGRTRLVPVGPKQLSHQITGQGELASKDIVYLYDNRAAVAGDINQNDGFFTFQAIDASSMETITFLPATYSFTWVNGFNPDLEGLIFTGNVFLADHSGNQIGSAVAVPEPATFLLPSLVALFVLFKRRR